MPTKTLAVFVSLSLLGASSAAAAQSAAPLSLAASPAARAGAATTNDSSLDRRGYGIYIVGAIVLGLIVWGAIKLLDNNTHAMPASP